MGILLPPVPQATVTTLTLHHRNRSLDSALQRIPEVDVTPSPECETVPDPTTQISTPSIKSRNREREDLASLGSDDSGILCGSDSGSSDAANVTTRESSVDHLHSRESLDSSLSQAGDMDCVDTVDGDENIVVSITTTDNKLINSHDNEKYINNDNVVIKQHDNNQQLLIGNDCLLKCELKNISDCTAKELHDEQPCGTNVLGSYHHNALEVAVQRELAGAAMTLCCGATQPDDETMKKPFAIRRQESQPKPTEGCLLRLFESQIFDMSMAISYLFNSKEPGVQSYLGKFIFIS